MLVLRRRAGESLMIGDDVEIEFLEVNSQNVKIGIRAPREITILRKELQLTRMQNRAAASHVDLADLNLASTSVTPVLTSVEFSVQEMPQWNDKHK
jgi:carbon storage regulator